MVDHSLEIGPHLRSTPTSLLLQRNWRTFEEIEKHCQIMMSRVSKYNSWIIDMQDITLAEDVTLDDYTRLNTVIANLCYYLMHCSVDHKGKRRALKPKNYGVASLLMALMRTRQWVRMTYPLFGKTISVPACWETKCVQTVPLAPDFKQWLFHMDEEEEEDEEEEDDNKRKREDEVEEEEAREDKKRRGGGETGIEQ